MNKIIKVHIKLVAFYALLLIVVGCGESKEKSFEDWLKKSEFYEELSNYIGLKNVDVCDVIDDNTLCLEIRFSKEMFVPEYMNYIVNSSIAKIDVDVLMDFEVEKVKVVYNTEADVQVEYEGEFSTETIRRMTNKAQKGQYFESVAKYFINEIPPEVAIVYNQILETVIREQKPKMSLFELLYHADLGDQMEMDSTKKEVLLLLELLSLKPIKFEREIYFLEEIIKRCGWR